MPSPRNRKGEVVVPQYTIEAHSLMCGGLTAVERDNGVKMATKLGVRWFCGEGCPLFEIFLRLEGLDQ